MNIDNITSESMTLTNDGKSMQIKVYEELIDKLQSNWNSLREYYKRKAEETKDSTSLYDKWTKYSSVVNKMNELEGRDKE